MKADNNTTSFFDKVLLFIGIDVHKAKWVVTVARKLMTKIFASVRKQEDYRINIRTVFFA